MIIAPIDTDGYLYAVSEIFPPDLMAQILATPWLDLPYQRLEIGRGRRRLIDYNSVEHLNQVDAMARHQLRAQVEEQCGVKFVDDKFYSINWWVDEPGFLPAMHTDGDLPSAIQVYIDVNNDLTLGTTFFNTPSRDDVMHRFPSISNTGYMMFNSHTVNGARKLLWHDMERKVPESVYRVCCYITLGSYQR